MPVLGGVEGECTLRYGDFCATVPKGEQGRVTVELALPEAACAPVSAGEAVGRVIYHLNGEEIGATDVVATADVAKMTVGALFCRMLAKFLLI